MGGIIQSPRFVSSDCLIINVMFQFEFLYASVIGTVIVNSP